MPISMASRIRQESLCVSWTVRETSDASTNHDFYFALSEDAGRTWKQTNGQTVALPIKPSTHGIKVYTIPQNSQIINQEAQRRTKRDDSML